MSDPQLSQQPQSIPPPTNILMLSLLYDSAASDLQAALATKKITLTDERIKGKVKWLGEVANTLSVVYQVELMRMRPKEGAPALPAALVNVVDPALVESQKNKLGHPGIPGMSGPGLDQYPSPGGWRP